jgi:hypothetical protein
MPRINMTLITCDIETERMQPPSLPDESIPSLGLLHLWLARATAVERIVYHRGLLTRDRAAVTGLSPGERQALSRLADAVFSATEEGRVHLVQHRNGPFDFSYLAIKASPGTHRLAAPAAPSDGRPPLWSRRLSPRSPTVSCGVFA